MYIYNISGKLFDFELQTRPIVTLCDNISVRYFRRLQRYMYTLQRI